MAAIRWLPSESVVGVFCSTSLTQLECMQLFSLVEQFDEDFEKGAGNDFGISVLGMSDTSVFLWSKVLFRSCRFSLVADWCSEKRPAASNDSCLCLVLSAQSLLMLISWGNQMKWNCLLLLDQCLHAAFGFLFFFFFSQDEMCFHCSRWYCSCGSVMLRALLSDAYTCEVTMLPQRAAE